MTGWKQTEREIARMLGARPTAGSGAGRRKGDIDTDQHKIEVKQTSRLDHYSLSVTVLDKIAVEARAVGKVPALAIACRLARCWILLERFKAQPSPPPWRTLRLRLYPILEPTEIESELAYWRVYPFEEGKALLTQSEGLSPEEPEGDGVGDGHPV